MKFSKKPKKVRLSAVLAASATICCLALIGFAGAAHAQVTLGPTGEFALLADDGALTVGNHTLLTGAKGNLGATYSPIMIGGNNTQIIGDAIAALFGQVFAPPVVANISLFNYANVVGTCATDNGQVILGTNGDGLATCSDVINDAPDTNPDIVLLGNAVDQEEVFDQAVLCQKVTLTDSIILADSQKSTIKTIPGLGLNVINSPGGITLGNSSTLTLSGAPTDTVILETTGTITVGSSAKIVLVGLVPQNVWITSTTEFVGFHAPASPPTTIIGNSSTINGTIHGGETCSLGTGVAFNGALICDYGITAGNNLTLNFLPATGISLPACPI
jgi:hypothetical protein